MITRTSVSENKLLNVERKHVVVANMDQQSKREVDQLICSKNESLARNSGAENTTTFKRKTILYYAAVLQR